jgi:hypothetical protein
VPLNHNHNGVSTRHFHLFYLVLGKYFNCSQRSEQEEKKKYLLI